MNELSLFTGSGGGVLGTHLLGWKHCGYVEYDDYCQRVIAQRIKDGILDEAPIFGDVRAFIGDGYAAAYQGLVDVVSAGFPCQPFSFAGKRQGDADERNMWPATIECIRIIRPRYALLENVPGLLAHEYARRIFGDLAESGYDVRWRVLSAAELGAPHKRDRLWILAVRCRDVAYPESMGWGDGHTQDIGPEYRKVDALGNGGEVLAHAEGIAERTGLRQDEPGGIGRGRFGDGSCATCRAPSCEPGYCKISDTEGGRLAELRSTPGNAGHADSLCETMADSARIQQGREEQRPERERAWAGSEQVCNTECGRCNGNTRGRTRTITPNGCWWESEPDVGRVAHGVASRVDRLKAIGNGQVPAVVRAAWEILSQ